MQKGDDTLPNISLTALAPESQTLIYMVTAPTAYHRSSKCMKTSKKHKELICMILMTL